MILEAPQIIVILMGSVALWLRLQARDKPRIPHSMAQILTWFAAWLGLLVWGGFFG